MDATLPSGTQILKLPVSNANSQNSVSVSAVKDSVTNTWHGCTWEIKKRITTFFCQITYFTWSFSYLLFSKIIYLLNLYYKTNFTIALLFTLLLLYPLSIWMTQMILYNYISTGIYMRSHKNAAHKLRDRNLKTIFSILTWIKESHKQHICIFLELYDVCTPPQRHWENNNTTF